jgi:hypothetical protein
VTKDVAVGFALHTGWAVAVAVGGSAAAPEVVARHRVELVDDTLPRQVFHAAADGPVGDAEALVRSVERSARAHADRVLGRLQSDLEASGHRLAAVAMCAEPHDVPTDLARILANHTLIHTAEGELYREAVEQAAEWLGVPVLQVAAKRVGATVAAQLGISTDRQQAVMARLGKELGPPWRADHKQATLLAGLALAELPARP